jgi:glutaminyl-tRNA synthetase
MAFILTRSFEPSSRRIVFGQRYDRQCAPMESEPRISADFLRQLIAADIAAGKHDGRVQTRFPPEPNGYLHIGHAKAICINFGVAEEFGGSCFLRFDDTNPAKETVEFVAAILDDVRWLGFDWGDNLRHASDYFEALYDFAVELIGKGKAYVDHQSAEEIRANRGTLTSPGVDSPYRDRSAEENLALFRKMRGGEFADGECVLRARLDMASPNINLRDPALYRIRHVAHQRTGDAWCIYPMYDFAHTLSDALEGTTHSLCSLEFEDHRPLYNWLVDNVSVPHRPEQTEFSRLNLMYTVMSKRKLKQLVDEEHVEGWDDPRMPTLAGFRRRGYTPASIRDFIGRVGVTKKDNLIELGSLESCIRDDLNENAERRFAVLDPLRIVIENYPDGQVEQMLASNHPNRPELETREIPFSREVWIERDDFLEDAPRKFFRLKPGGEVRLRYAYIVKCERIEKDADGRITTVYCSYDPDTRSGTGKDAERKVKGTIHWVSVEHAVAAEVRLYDRLFKVPSPGVTESIDDEINEDSLRLVEDAKLEPGLLDALPGQRFQFERLGYFYVDTKLSRSGQPVFNRVVTLRDTWGKLEQAALAAIRS